MAAVNVGGGVVEIEVDGEVVADFLPARARAIGQALIAAAGEVPADEIGHWGGTSWRDGT